MRTKLFTFIALAFSTVVFGQQEPVYSQYMFNPTVMNPAYCGIYDMVSATAVYRAQYLGLGAGRPQTMTFNAHSSLPLDKMGGGVTFVRDVIGINVVNKFELLYSYRLDIGDNRLSMGMSTGFGNYISDPSRGLTAKSEDDPYFISQRASAFKPSFGFGAMYLAEDFFVGVSAPSMFNQSISEGDDAVKINKRHMYATGGYVLRLANEMVFKPSLLVRYVDGSPISFDLNASVLMYQNLWAGLSFRKLNTVVLMGQLQVTDAMKLGASFDFSSNSTIKEVAALNKMGFTGVSAFELMANFNFGLFDTQAVQTSVY